MHGSIMLFQLIAWCLVTVALGDEQIHKGMSSDEVQQIFQASHDSVPDYKVVQFSVSRLVKRGTRSSRFIRSLHSVPFEGDLRLRIQPAEGHLAGRDTPVYIAKRNGLQITYTEYAPGLRNVGQLMEDPPLQASMILRKDSQGRYHINGVVRSKRLVIRSLPDEMANRLLQNRTSIDRRSAYHVVYRQERSDKGTRVGATGSGSRSSSGQSDDRVDPIPATQTVVYPEIMLVLDSTYYSINNNNVDQILAYAVTFWNGVDLMYRSLEQPKFRFNLKTIIIAETPNAVTYIFDNMVRNTNSYDSQEAINDAGEYYYSLRKFPRLSYDAVITMSRNTMIGPDLGIARTSGACRVRDSERMAMNVALVTDNGSFDGVHTAAHEFGHLVGATHDDDDLEIGCRPKDGYIMTAETEITEHSHDFSTCSIQLIQRYLNRAYSRCLFNEPVTVAPLKRTLPGQMRDRNDQCAKEGFASSCFDENNSKHSPCLRIYCRPKSDSSKCSEGEALVPDGAFCGRGKMCFHGHCVGGFPV